MVENSYVASQNFNRWLGEARAQQQLGWSATASRAADGRVHVAVAGTGPEVSVKALARHPLGRQPDRTITFDRGADSVFVSSDMLPAGRWTLHLELREGMKTWRQEQDLP